jgi:hypothetical protein
LTPSARLSHYWNSSQKKPTTVPEGWTSGLAQYAFHISKKLRFDEELSEDYFNQPCFKVYPRGEKVAMTPFEYSFQIIADIHCKSNALHLSRDKTYKKIKGLSSTIPKEVIAAFLQCCPHPTCVERREKGTQHSADVAAVKKRKAESGPSIHEQPKRKRIRLQSQEQEQQPHFPAQIGQSNNERYQLQQLQQQPLPNLPMGQHNNGHVLGAPDMRETFGQMQQNEEYQPQQHQQPFFLNAADVQYYNNGNGFQQQYPPIPEVHYNNGDNFAVLQQPLNFQMEQDNNAYPPQPSLLGAPGYERYTYRSQPQQQQQQQQQQFENIDPALLNNTDPTFREDHSSNNQEQPQEAATTGDVPMDENDNGDEDFLMDLDFEKVLAALRR